MNVPKFVRNLKWSKVVNPKVSSFFGKGYDVYAKRKNYLNDKILQCTIPVMTGTLFAQFPRFYGLYTDYMRDYVPEHWEAVIDSGFVSKLSEARVLKQNFEAFDSSFFLTKPFKWYFLRDETSAKEVWDNMYTVGVNVFSSEGLMFGVGLVGSFYLYEKAKFMYRKKKGIRSEDDLCVEIDGLKQDNEKLYGENQAMARFIIDELEPEE